MKKIGIVILFCGVVSILNAQTLKGRLFLSGNFGVGLGSQKSESDNYNYPRSYNNFYINPSIGYYVSDRFALGLQLGYFSAKDKFSSYYQIYDGNTGIYTNQIYTVTQKSKSYTIAPLIRYTKSVSEKFSFNLNFTIPYTHEKFTFERSEYSNFIDGFIYNSIGLYITPELQYFVTNKIALTASFGGLGYNYTTRKDDDSQSNNNSDQTQKNNIFDLGLGSRLTIGATVFFGGKEKN